MYQYPIHRPLYHLNTHICIPFLSSIISYDTMIFTPLDFILIVSFQPCSKLFLHIPNQPIFSKHLQSTKNPLLQLPLTMSLAQDLLRRKVEPLQFSTELKPQSSVISRRLPCSIAIACCCVPRCDSDCLRGGTDGWKGSGS